MAHRTGLFLLVLCVSFAAMQAQIGYRWAVSGGSDGFFDNGLDVDVDAAGNVFLAAEYEDRATFMDTLLYAQGGPDLLIAKLSPAGELIWLNTAGSTVHDRAYAVDAAPDGSVWMAGYGKILFPQSRTLHTRDALVARYRSDGSLAWGRYMDGDQYSEGRDIVGDAAGNATLTGVIKVNGWYPGDTLFGHGFSDAFLVRFDSTGDIQWVKAIGGPGDDAAWKVAADPAGNLVVCGFFSQTADFGGSTRNATGGKDAFVAKYSPGGTLIWVKALGGPGNDEVLAVETSEDGSIYFAGNFEDSIVTNVGTVVSVAAVDVCYGKLDAAGNLVWIKSAGGSNLDYVQDLDVDSKENVYFGGYFFEGFTIDTVTVQSIAFDNMYWAKVDSNGTLLRLETALYNDSRDVLGIAVDDAQNVVVTGLYGQLIQLGSYTLPAVLGTIDFFVAKFATAQFSLQIDSVVGSPYCGSDLFTVVVDMQGMPDTGSVFYLELSDASGSFANPDTVGQYAGLLPSSISGQLPLGLSGGSGYRLRVVCSSPAFTSNDNGYDLTLNPTAAVAVAIQGDSVICGGVPVLLYVDQGLSSQLWSNGDTNYFIYASQPGMYWVDGIDSSGCTNRDAIMLVPCVSVIDPSSQDWLAVYPNPARDQMRISLATNGRVDIQLYDVFGRSVMQSYGVPGRSDQLFHVAGLPRGIYYLSASSSFGTATQRVILD